MIRPHHAALVFLLAACTPGKPVEEGPRSLADAAPAEAWRLEALATRKEMAQRPPDPNDRSGFRARIDALLDQPDPPAKPGPELRVIPPDGTPVPWPPPKEGMLTLRYRIENKDCRADMGCRLAALCPADTNASVPVVEKFEGQNLDVPWNPVSRPQVLEVPSPRCELRLYARDHEDSRVCTSRGPKLPATWSGTTVVDLGTIGFDSGVCERDELADRAILRGNLAWTWRHKRTEKEKR